MQSIVNDQEARKFKLYSGDWKEVSAPSMGFPYLPSTSLVFTSFLSSSRSRDLTLMVSILKPG